MAISKYTIAALAVALFVFFVNESEASLAVGRLMRPGRSLAVGRTFRPGRSLASGRPFFRPGKRAPEVEESYMSDHDQKRFERDCKPEVLDEYTNELIDVVKVSVEIFLL